MVQVTLKLIFILVLAGFIGWDREKQGRPAGFRTHILVGIGSTLIMIVSINIYKNFPGSDADPARLAAQVVSGIGFLGAGTILIQGSIVKGLTTAASLWTIAAIGLAVGAGHYYLGAVATVIVFIALFFLSNIEHEKTKVVAKVLKCRMEYDKKVYEDLIKKLNSNDNTIRELNTLKDKDNSNLLIDCRVDIENSQIDEIGSWLLDMEIVKEVNWRNSKYSRVEIR
ncbi:MAG: MgtC/SapB family protein [Halanaerobiaceae bacterium]